MYIYLHTYMYPPTWQAVRDKPSRFRTGSDSTGRRARGSTPVYMYIYICVYVHVHIEIDI